MGAAAFCNQRDLHHTVVISFQIFAFSGSKDKVSLQDLYLCSSFSLKKKMEVVIKN